MQSYLEIFNYSLGIESYLVYSAVLYELRKADNYDIG